MGRRAKGQQGPDDDKYDDNEDYNGSQPAK